MRVNVADGFGRKMGGDDIGNSVTARSAWQLPLIGHRFRLTRVRYSGGADGLDDRAE